jgi:hypothetical protein
MINYKFQNPIKTALWQNIMDSVMCFHPSSWQWCKGWKHIMVIDFEQENVFIF